MDIETIHYEDMHLTDPVGIIGFPSIGLISSIMANMYVNSLKMTPMAGMTSPLMPPYCTVANGKPLPPVRFYGYKNPKKNGRDVIICQSEYTPKPEECYALSLKIISFLKQKGCKMVICLEGTPRYEESPIIVCADGPNAQKLIKKTKLTEMTNGMIRGITGTMMYEAPSKGLDAISIMVPATPNVPDPGAAASFIEPVSKLVSGFKVTPKELLKEAELINKQIESNSSNANDTSQYIG